MTYKDFSIILSAAHNEADKSRFIAEWSSSSIFYPNPEEGGPAPEQVSGDLGNAWDVAHMSMADIRKAAGMTQAQFAVRYCIPLRTVQNWEWRDTCPIYMRLMLAELQGLVSVERS